MNQGDGRLRGVVQRLRRFDVVSFEGFMRVLRRIGVRGSVDFM